MDPKTNTETGRSPVSGRVHEPSYGHRVLERKRLKLAMILTASGLFIHISVADLIPPARKAQNTANAGLRIAGALVSILIGRALH